MGFPDELRGNRIPAALWDVFEKRPSSGRNLEVLDGVRGLAVLLVIASHTGGLGLRGHGGVGVWLFFVLSAFLLTLPFVEPSRGRFTGSALAVYAGRRLKRILPAYYFFVAMAFLYRGGSLDFLGRHLLFLQGDGVWWTIPQEMLFYVLLPLFAAIHAPLGRRHGRTILALGAAAVAANLFLDTRVFSMDGNAKRLPFHLGIFLAGMAAAYAYRWPTLARLRTPQLLPFWTVLGFVLMFLLFATAPEHHQRWAGLPGLDSLEAPLGWKHPGTFGALCAALVLLALWCEDGPLGRILGWVPLRAVGVVSFSLYLVHMLVLQRLQALGLPPGNTLFAATTGVGFVLACVGYALIERPFLSRPR